jgi:hypothetical protein
MDDARWERIAALGGIVFVVLNVIGSFLPGAPPSPDNAEDIAKFFTDHTGAIQVAQVLAGIGAIGLIWWFGSLWRIMSRAEGERPRMALVAAVSLGLAGTLALLSGAINSATSLRIGEIGSGAEVFYVLSSVVISTSGFGLVAHLAAVASLNYRKHMFPAWITYLGWVGALGFLIASFGSASDAGALGILGLISFLVWCVWIVGISILMWQGAGQTATDSPIAA